MKKKKEMSAYTCSGVVIGLHCKLKQILFALAIYFAKWYNVQCV